MRKSEIIAALDKIQGDPEIEVRMLLKNAMTDGNEHGIITIFGEPDRINRYPRPEIVVIEK